MTTVHTGVETIQGGNYSREETIRGNTVHTRTVSRKFPKCDFRDSPRITFEAVAEAMFA